MPIVLVYNLDDSLLIPDGRDQTGNRRVYDDKWLTLEPTGISWSLDACVCNIEQCNYLLLDDICVEFQLVCKVLVCVCNWDELLKNFTWNSLGGNDGAISGGNAGIKYGAYSSKHARMLLQINYPVQDDQCFYHCCSRHLQRYPNCQLLELRGICLIVLLYLWQQVCNRVGGRRPLSILTLWA